MIYAKDTKTSDSLAIHFEDLPIYAEFFLALNGIEKADYQKENPADIKAAERFTKIYDELIKINSELAKKEADGKSFNLFLIRSLFLYFCEDTEIIAKGSFTNILKTRTDIDGSNLNSVMEELFLVLDMPEDKRHTTPEWLKKFPYVNGKLFREPHLNLKFNTLTRKLLIEAGELLNWNEINPDILGAMIQTVANKEERQVSGMHYTSVTNILKVIKPLFLDNLQEEYQKLSDRADDYVKRKITEKQRREQQRNIIKDLNNLLERMSKIKFLDPACGSGNFLIITYKELRKLEIYILVKIREVQDALKEKNVYQGEFLKQSKIKLKQFSGIELDDFAHEVAKLSLYIAEHQMNVEMMESLADYQPRILPLQESGNIVHSNALRLDWNDVVPQDVNDEIYIMGNPPYIGYSPQNADQKEDLFLAVGKDLKYKSLDYISGWFYKAANFIEYSNSKFAFVTTNSICQGEQVPLIWEYLLEKVEIEFTYTSFKWSNSAKNSAAVIVAIIGLANKNNIKSKRVIYDENLQRIETSNITPYLTLGESIIVRPATEHKFLPKLVLGSMPKDGGGLIISEEEEYKKIISNYPELKENIKIYLGSSELIKGNKRYVIWLNELEYHKLNDNPEINRRVNIVKEMRLNSKAESTRELAKIPWEFAQKGDYTEAYDKYKSSAKSDFLQIIIPRHSSENRDYLPLGFVGEETIVADSAMVVYNAPIWLLGILESRMHMIWLRSVGGRLKTDYRYSAGMVYNTFPIPKLSTNRKTILEEAVWEMLDVREEEGGTLAELYGGANKPMNVRLREAHEKIDGIVERAYKQEPFKSDDERLSVLLKLYQEMISEEKK